MKILLSALACNPLWGSEAAVGWSVLSTLAKNHEVWVLLHEHNRPFFDQFSASSPLPENIHLHFLGENKPHHPNRLMARAESWRENFRWHSRLLGPARELHQKHRFDLVHHATYATWRVASPLWQLGIPFIWGPLGGGEIFPWRAAKILSPTALLFEFARASGNFISKHNRAVRDCARKATVCVAGNQETFETLRQLRGSSQGIESLCVSFFLDQIIDEFKALLPGKPNGGEALRLFAGGNLEGRKGVAIALDALAQVKEKGVPFEYRLGGGGPELAHLQAAAKSHGLEENVIFGDSLRGEDYRNQLRATHIYLLPSLRDNSGRTLMEAMLAGCVPIVADCGGPADIVTDQCGFRIPVSGPAEMARAIAEIIAKLNADRSLLAALGRAAHERIASHYSEKSYLQSLEAIYKKSLGQ